MKKTICITVAFLFCILSLGAESASLMGGFGFKLAAGPALPVGSSLKYDSDSYGGIGMGPAIHLSVFKKIARQFDVSAGIEYFFLSGGKKGQMESSAVSTLCIFTAGRYSLMQLKMFFEGGLGFFSHKIKYKSYYDPNNWSYGENSKGTVGIKLGIGYKIVKCIEIELCTSFAARNVVSLMIGFKK